MNAPWNNVQINEVAELIEELDDVILNKQFTSNAIYSVVMKKSTYVIDLELWIKVMWLLIYECRMILDEY